jgi:peptidase E
MNLGKVAFYSKDEDYPETIFYDALGITDLTIDPHFDINDKDRVNEAIKGSKKHKIIGLPDYSAIVIEEDDSIKNIGVNYVFEGGKMK